VALRVAAVVLDSGEDGLREELLLRAVPLDHQRGVDPGAPRNGADRRPGQPALGKFRLGGAENALRGISPLRRS